MIRHLRCKWQIVFALSLPAFVVHPLLAATPPLGLTLTTSADYSSGTYGETDKTRIFSVTECFQYDHERWTFKLSVPYIHISGPGTVIPGVGKVTKVTLPPRHDEAGQGDTTVSASYIAHQSADAKFTLAAGGEVKFGSADAAKGLGTGKEDFAGHVDAYWTHELLTTFVTLGYRILGDPPGSDLLNTINGTVGCSYQLKKEASVGLTYSASQKSSASSGAQAEFVAFATYKFREVWNTQIYVMAGTTKASPTIGTGLSIGRMF